MFTKHPVDTTTPFEIILFKFLFLGVAPLNNLLYIIGGNDGSTFLDTCECYDPHTNKWCSITPMSIRRAGVGCAVLDGYLYVAGNS